MAEKNFRVRKGLTVDGTGDSSIAGNLGIGTFPFTRYGGATVSGPDTMLHLASGTGDVTLKIEADIENDTEAHNPMIWMVQDGGLVSFKLGLYDSGNHAYLDWGNDVDKDLILKNNGTEKYRFTGDGKLGVGTTSPGTSLHLSDAENVTLSVDSSHATGAQISLDSTGTGGDEWRIVSGADNAGIGGGAFGLYNVDASAYRFNVTSAGNVGIGTATPDVQLHVEGSANQRIRVQDTTDNYALTMAGHSSGVFLMGGDMDSSEASWFKFGAFSGTNNMDTKDRDFHIYGTNTATGFYFDESQGYFGIGTIAPDAPLHINRTADNSGGYKAHMRIDDAVDFDAANNGGAITFGGRYQTGSTNLAYWAKVSGEKENTTTNETGGTLRFWTRANGGAPTQKMIIDSAGKVGIGTTSPSEALHIRSSSDHPLVLENDQNAAYVGIQFSDHAGGSYAQKGEFRFNHADGSSQGSGASFTFTTTESDLSIIGGKFISAVGSASEPGFGFSGDVDNGMFHPATNEIAFTTAGAEAVRIDADGNVGIGTAAPIMGLADSIQLNVHNPTTRKRGILQISSGSSTNADVIGSLWFSNDDNSDATNFDGGGKMVAAIEAYVETTDSNGGDDSGADLAFITKPDGSGIAERMRITSAGNVGIGTDTPPDELTVEGNEPVLSIYHNENVGSVAAGDVLSTISFRKHTGNSGNETIRIYNVQGDSGASGASDDYHTSDLRISTRLIGSSTYTDRFTILGQEGYIGIGTTSPDAKLEVQGAGVLTRTALVTISGNTNLSGISHAGRLLHCTSACTLSLQATPTAGEQQVIYNDSSGTITIAANGSDTINGSTNDITITSRYKAITVIAVSASAWLAIGA